MREKTVGVVLAGGSSRRLGRDKADLRWAGESFAESAVRRLGEVAGEVLLADRGRRLVSGVESIGDGPGRGPVAGILGAATARPGRDLLILACDLPRVPVTLLRSLSGEPGDWVVPRWRRRLEPLCALYRPPALEALAARVGDGRWDLQGLAATPGLSCLELGPEVLAKHGDPAYLLLNVNRPGDLAVLRGGTP